jgi:hypothetical protein
VEERIGVDQYSKSRKEFPSHHLFIDMTTRLPGADATNDGSTLDFHDQNVMELLAKRHC